MPVNRYTDINFNQPVSSYVPMPLDLMYKVGAHKQAGQDKAEEDRMDLLGKQWNRLSKDADRANKIKSEVNSTLDEFAGKDFNDPTVKSQWYKKKRELADRFGPMGDIGAMEQNYKIHQDYVKGLDELRKKGPKEGGIDLDTYNKLRNISLGEYKGIGQDEGQGYNQFSGVQPAGYVDMAEWFDKKAEGWKADKIANEGWTPTEDGMLYKKYGNKTEWIKPEDIYNQILPQGMNDPMLQAFAKQKIMLDTHGQNEFFGQDEKGRPVQYNPDYAKKTMYEEMFKRPAEFAANKYGFKSTEQTSDMKFTPWAKDAHDKTDALSGLVGYSLEGKTYNAIDNDSQYKTLESQGVFTKDKSGNVKVDWSALGDTKEKIYENYNYDKGSVNRQVGEKTTKSTTKQVALYNQMKKMADVVGFKGDLNPKQYDNIVSAYNILSKARLFAEQLPEPVTELESSKLDNNWEHVTAYDPNNSDTPIADKPVRAAGDKIIVNERQTNSKGEMIKKGVIVRKDGTREPFAIKDNALESTNYFDAIGKLGITSAKFQVGEINGVTDGSGKTIKTQDGLHVIHQEEIPYVGRVTAVGDSKDRGHVSYRLVTNDGQKVPFTNYSDLQRYLETEYYTKVPEGKTDLNYLLDKKKDKMIESFPEQ